MNKSDWELLAEQAYNAYKLRLAKEVDVPWADVPQPFKDAWVHAVKVSSFVLLTGMAGGITQSLQE